MNCSALSLKIAKTLKCIVAADEGIGSTSSPPSASFNPSRTFWRIGIASPASRVRTTHPLPTTHPLITQPDPVTCRVGYIGKTRPNPLGILGRVGWVFTLNTLPKSCECHMYYIELFSRECIVKSILHIPLITRSITISCIIDFQY